MLFLFAAQPELSIDSNCGTAPGGDIKTVRRTLHGSSERSFSAARRSQDLSLKYVGVEIMDRRMTHGASILGSI